MKLKRMLNEAAVCSLCYCPNIWFAWRDSVRLYVHSMTL